MQIRLFYFFGIALFCSIAASELSCFYPDGKNATGLIPCKSDGSVSHCCREADVCLSNGMCFSSGLGSIVRRGCTDKTWQSSDCPNVCVNDTFNSADAVLTPCGTYNNFCCGQDEAARTCCNSGNATLAVKVAGGDPMFTETRIISATGCSTPTGFPLAAAGASCPASLRTSRSALIGIAGAFGCLMLVFAALAILCWKKMKKQEREKTGNETELVALEQDKKMLEEDYDWLYKELPAPIRREMEARREARLRDKKAASSTVLSK